MLLVSIALASVPAGAFERVCVLNNGGKSVEASRCKMSCCHPVAKIQTVSVHSDCCTPTKPTKGFASDRSTICAIGNLNCQCELRFVPAVIPITATLARSSIDGFDTNAILIAPKFDAIGWHLLNFEPGIVGVDSGPPTKLSRSPLQPRAPPVQTV